MRGGHGGAGGAAAPSPPALPMNEAGGGERCSHRSGPSQTPCKASCRAGAGLDTRPQPPQGLSPWCNAPGGAALQTPGGSRLPAGAQRRFAGGPSPASPPWGPPQLSTRRPPLHVPFPSTSLGPHKRKAEPSFPLSPAAPRLRPARSLHLPRADAAHGSAVPAWPPSFPALFPAPSVRDALGHRHRLLLAGSARKKNPLFPPKKRDPKGSTHRRC